MMHAGWRLSPEPRESRALKFRCPKCNRRLHVSNARAGKKAKCPACSTPLAIPRFDPAEMVSCPVCGNELIPGERVCNKCLSYVDGKKKSMIFRQKVDPANQTDEAIPITDHGTDHGRKETGEHAPAPKADMKVQPPPAFQPEPERPLQEQLAPDEEELDLDEALDHVSPDGADQPSPSAAQDIQSAPTRVEIPAVDAERRRKKGVLLLVVAIVAALIALVVLMMAGKMLER
jgi:ribosomal protein S27E